MTKELKFLIDIVKEASKIITDEFEVKAKDDKGDLVTNFDYEVEQFIINKIKKEYPTFTIISEEFNTNEELTDNCFTIDPIDGTINFANKLPLWGIQVACIKDGKTCAAVIYLPKLNEFYYADENGAFMNDKRISVNNMKPDRGLYSVEGEGNTLIEYKMKKINNNYRNFYCAAANFSFVASGKLSATCFVWHTLWDYIPGIYIVEKAGGVVYNDKKRHIAANNKEFLNVLIENSDIDNDSSLSTL